MGIAILVKVPAQWPVEVSVEVGYGAVPRAPHVLVVMVGVRKMDWERGYRRPLASDLLPQYAPSGFSSRQVSPGPVFLDFIDHLVFVSNGKSDPVRTCELEISSDNWKVCKVLQPLCRYLNMYWNTCDVFAISTLM